MPRRCSSATSGASRPNVGDLTWYYLERTFTSRVAHEPVLGAAPQHAFGGLRGHRPCGHGRRDAGLAAGSHRHVRPQMVRDGADRALHAAGLDLRAGLDDAVQEPHRRRPGRLVRVARLHAAGLAVLRPAAGDDHPGAALRALHHPAVRQRAAPLRFAARGLGPHTRRRAADGDAQDHPAADAALADVGDRS